MYTVNSCTYLQWVDPPVVESVVSHATSKGVKVSYKRGTTILHEGEVVQNAHFLAKGWVAYYVNNLRGESKIVCLVGPKRVFGLGEAFDMFPINLSVKAIEDCKVYLVSKADLIETMADNLEARIAVISILYNRLRCVIEGANLFSSLLSPKERLINFFVSMLQSYECKKHGDWFELPVNLSHERIGEIIGASRVTVSRIISKYKITGKLKNCKNKLYVHRELILEEYGEIGI